MGTRQLAVASCLVVACGGATEPGDDMMGGRRRIEVDQSQGYGGADNLQNYITWGDKQGVESIRALAPGSIIVFPAVPGLQQFPASFSGFKQIVNAQYRRPTTWSISLYAAALSPMPTSDAFTVNWTVRSSVGQATNDLQFSTSFVSPGLSSPPGPLGGQVLQTFQLAAQAIQITPNQIIYSMGASGQFQAFFFWSAWVAPIVD